MSDIIIVDEGITLDEDAKRDYEQYLAEQEEALERHR